MCVYLLCLARPFFSPLARALLKLSGRKGERDFYKMNSLLLFQLNYLLVSLLLSLLLLLSSSSLSLSLLLQHDLCLLALSDCTCGVL